MATRSSRRHAERWPHRTRRALASAWAHPAWWAWPAAAVLTYAAPVNAPALRLAVRWYYLPALLLVLVGCLPTLRGCTARRVRPRPTLLPRRALVVLTIAILAGAVALRLWRLTDWPPPGIGFEEHELASRGNLAGGPLDNFVTIYAKPIEHALTAYAVSVSFALFGTGFLEMRLPFIIAGILSPLLFYALCRRLVAWEPALFAVALFGVSWWQIAGGRPADEIFFPLWVELAVLVLLLRFEDTAETWAAFGLALCSGLLIYEYAAYHLAMPLVMAYLAARALRFAGHVLRAPQPWRERRRRLVAGLAPYLPGGIAMLLVWTILARLQLWRDIRLGMGSWLLEGVRRHRPNGIFGQLDDAHAVAAFAGARVADTLRSFYTTGYSGEDRFLGIGMYPAFDPTTAAAIALGAVCVALTPRRRLHVFVLAWLALIVLGVALLPGNVNTHRCYVGLPFFFLLVALGAGVLWDGLRWPAARAMLVGLFALAAAVAAAANIHRLYWDLFPDPFLRQDWIWPRTQIARWIRERPRDARVCVVSAVDDPGILGTNPLLSQWRWMLRGWTVDVAGRVDGCLPNAAGGAPPARYVVFAVFGQPSPPADLLAQLRRGYPAVRELSPIELEDHRLVARAFDAGPPPP